MLPNLFMLAISSPLDEQQREERKKQGRKNYMEWRKGDNEAQVEEMAELEIAEREEMMPDYFLDWTEDVSYERSKEFERRQAENGETDDEAENESTDTEASALGEC